MWRTAVAVVLFTGVAGTAAATLFTNDVIPAPPDVPFGVGEDLTYEMEAKWFLVSGRGTARMQVEAIDTVHGHPTYRLALSMQGGIAFFSMNDVQRSWLDVEGLFSRRFHQKLDQTSYERDRTYDFFPGRMVYVEPDKPGSGGDLATQRPLDDVSFLYHVRTLPLVVGEEYTEPRYYKSEGNPVTVRVLRTERVKVPAGEFDAIVVQPIIRTDGLFGEGGEAEVWLSNDDWRMPLRIRAKVSIATLTMELTSYTLSRGGRSLPRPQ